VNRARFHDVGGSATLLANAGDSSQALAPVFAF
jgi:hypothetical protein